MSAIHVFGRHGSTNEAFNLSQDTFMETFGKQHLFCRFDNTDYAINGKVEIP